MSKSTGKKRIWPLVLIFIAGFVIMMYPVVSNYYYRIEANNQIMDFSQNAKKLDNNEILRRVELAEAYNSTLDPSKLADPYTEKEKEGIAEYARMLEVKEKIGFVEIPKIDTDLPIYAGTSFDVLNKGVGHLEGTSLPIGGKSTHTVLTAHRGLPSARLFRDLDKLEKGDIFYVHNIQTVLAYEVDQILTVEPSNFDPVLVVEGRDYATLLTCTPYMINSHRLLVRGHRVPYVAPVKEDSRALISLGLEYRDMLAFTIPFSVVLFVLMLYSRSDYRKALRRYREYMDSIEEKKDE
ncbi:MAG: class C sortase [Peptoniphilus duerdenii]|uniref:class C sortase n=1 Tax=Peptoniphilus duerdenii TaxID=507750 RepID=UPI00254B1F54|nr:class C sortase [Peptoniphilus duerdenii]MDK8277168.1 class C sortase [Peptoniphilus duerdenii]